MGLAAKCISFLLFAFFAFLVFNFEILEAALHLAHRERKIDIAEVTHDVGLHFISKFRMLLGLNHHRSRHRGYQRSSTAPVPAPAPAPAPANEARSAAPTPLCHTPLSSRKPLAHRNHIAPARSAEYKRGGRGNSGIPETTIIVLAVVGASLAVLGVATVVLLKSRKFQKGCSDPFILLCHGSRAQKSPAATRKVSSHPSPDLLYLSSLVQCPENYPNLKQASESKSLSSLSTPPKSAELITGDYTVRNRNSMPSDEAESFHSIPCSHSLNGSIAELPLQICLQTTTAMSTSSTHTNNSPSGSSYKSLSPDFGPHFSSKFHTSTQSSLCKTYTPQKSDVENNEVNYQERTTNAVSGSTTSHETTKVKQTNSKIRDSPSEHDSLSRTNTASAPSNTEFDLNSKEYSRSSIEEAKLQTSNATKVSRPPPPPPPPPSKPPPSRKGQNTSQPPPPPPPLPLQIQVSKNGSPLPRLKPLHWDKVRAAPNRSMVWNDIRSSSFEFELDEQMIKSLFAYNFQGLSKTEDTKSKTISSSKHVIEHHKLQNTTILLKTLNASTEQVCNSITEGTGLSIQQLEALFKMKPTKEEEEKLLHYDGDFQNLDPAENFVKVILTIPMAFSRIEVMLYKETFEDEVAHLKMSFAMIEGACTELRSSKLFLRLLEAVLKTGNRMNVGTIRGGASAFRLDALLKLVDIRGADGKTTLLHFVVQEMVRSKGLKTSEKLSETPRTSHATTTEREDYLAMGTELVSELSNELCNVKKAASIDLDTLINSISNLSCGLAQLDNLIQKDLPNNDNNMRFLQCMKSFLNHAKNTMQVLKFDEGQVLLHVRELIKYYHGEFVKDESNLLHMFVIVKDFLALLDRVCREMRGTKHSQPLNLVLPLR